MPSRKKENHLVGHCFQLQKYQLVVRMAKEGVGSNRRSKLGGRAQWKESYQLCEVEKVLLKGRNI